jgi:hypothetical protein
VKIEMYFLLDKNKSNVCNGNNAQVETKNTQSITSHSHRYIALKTIMNVTTARDNVISPLLPW